MAWLAVDKDGTEAIYDMEPIRRGDAWEPELGSIGLTKGTIKKILNRTLTWRNNPVEF